MATTDTPPATLAAARLGLREQIRNFPGAFWAANGIEMIERWSYYGVRTVLSLYIVDAVTHGGLEFTHIQKGFIYAWWAVIQSLLPMFTGGFADRYGYKRTIAVSVTVDILGYLLMATQHSFGGFFLGCMMVATGTAIFKPGVQGIVANATGSRNAAVGWGIFYAMVNIGGFVGPISAGFLRAMSWKHVFIASACLIALNYLMLFVFKEPEHPPLDLSEGEHKKQLTFPPFMAYMGRSLPFNWVLGGAALVALGQFLVSHELPAGVLGLVGFLIAARVLYRVGYNGLPKSAQDNVDILVESLSNVFEPRLITFLLIFSGFWLMFMQLFDLLPNFIDDWVDSSGVILWVGQTLHLGALVQQGQAGLQIKPEWMVNLDAGAIVFLMIFVAFVFSRLKAIHSIILGMLVAAVGIVLAGATMNGALCLLGIFVFAIGEMMASPKMMEYLQSLAPPEKRALYMGYANVPLAIGWGIGSGLGGWMYQNFGDKVTFAKAYMADHLHLSPGAIQAIPKEKIMDSLAAQLHQSPREVTGMLFALHHPDHLWYIFGAIGLMSMLLMIGYDRVLARRPHRAEVS